MIDEKAGAKRQKNKNMRAVVHTHKDSSEVMKAFTEKKSKYGDRICERLQCRRD